MIRYGFKCSAAFVIGGQSVGYLMQGGDVVEEGGQVLALLHQAHGVRHLLLSIMTWFLESEKRPTHCLARSR